MGGRPPSPTLAAFGNTCRVWAVASIDGAAAALARLHDRISERFEAHDRIVYLGNYFGGEAPGAAIAELLDFRRRVIARHRGFACDVVFLRGAQEEMLQRLLELQFAANPGEVLTWMAGAGIAATLQAYGADLRQGFAVTRGGAQTITRWTSRLRNAINAAPGHTKLLSALRHAACLGENGVLFAHAGIARARPLSAQRDAFWWSRDDILALREPFAGFRRVVRGFDRQHRGLVEGEFAVSLDGGAGAGGPLLAACFGPDGTILDRLAA